MTTLTLTPTLPLRHALPTIIQGGMGVAVSSWRLASAVARRGQLGVVSGTALDLVLARRLEDGDQDGSIRRAMAAFPVPAIVQRVLARHLKVGGRAPGAPYRPVTRLSLRPSRAMQELTVLANFVEVWLAKEGHNGRVGINFLEKVQMALPAAAYGAMLAGVDAVLVGAGIPRHLPHLLNELALHRTTRMPVDVAGDPGGDHAVEIDPVDLVGPDLPPLERPMFLAIVSSEALAAYLMRDPSIRPDGFVVEGPLAGGHNAPPRGRPVRDERGQPVFGERDQANVAKMAAVGLPFWLAGSRGTPEGVRDAVESGAVGVQVGTAFALSSDSGLTPDLRDQLLTKLRAGELEVLTDGEASPTGFPFKVVQLEGTLSDLGLRDARPRLCDLGYLRTPYMRDDNRVGFRCPAEPVDMYVRKGGTVEDTVNRVCLCNALSADVGLGQTRPTGEAEETLLTLGSDLSGAQRLAELHPDGWSADQVLDWLLAPA
ncbi:nitronate monooxygenase [Cellulomonas composti]|uniref:2-nitropropane dioxygenase n=1 Tax=Cellulomonas composti TaxID=266130 RepID=A0A511JAH3_9CELL|nr:nitronate monooxygenase [Cellulomonas composti]GEL94987.1 2-nitropropane dioxygenase [Cellulomonas composti]